MSAADRLFFGDCLELLPTIPDGSVDMICADLPYGTTNCAWDVRIPMEPLWREFWRVTKHNAAVCLFAQNPFAADLISAARKFFRYEWVWEKTHRNGFLNAHKMPLRVHELILVFYRALPTYNPQKFKPSRLRDGLHFVHSGKKGSVYGKRNDGARPPWKESRERFPVDVVKFPLCALQKRSAHTEKPVALLEYLAKTYTDEGETILDPTMGSGSMGVACARTGRRFVGMEKDGHYFEVAKKRIEDAERDLKNG